MSQIIKNRATGPVPPIVATSYVTDMGTAIPAANVLNVLGGIGATTTGSGNTITVIVKNDGFTWTEQNADFGASVQNGYFCNAELTATLPTTLGPPALVIGNSVIFFVDTMSSVTIQAAAGQMIQVGSIISADAGIAVSNTQGAILELVYKPTDSTWHTISSLGVWTVT